MKIAFPTNDRKTIAKRTGRCKEFVIIEIKDNNFTYNYIVNNHEHDHNHDHKKNEEHEHSHSEIIKLLEGVDLLIVKNIGKYMKNDIDKSGVEYKKVTEEEIESVIKKYQKGDY